MKKFGFILSIAISLMLVACNTGKSLLYQDKDTFGVQLICKQYASGKGKEILVKNGEYPRWIPGTKTHFAYVERSGPSHGFKLWIAKEDGSNPKALTGFEVGYE
ncbi:MAG: hypothetical protein KJN70_13270, partial [Eudoraea sp.]|nr:hypothetical protein [Eudoraea sp.]